MVSQTYEKYFCNVWPLIMGYQTRIQDVNQRTQNKNKNNLETFFVTVCFITYNITRKTLLNISFIYIYIHIKYLYI